MMVFNCESRSSAARRVAAAQSKAAVSRNINRAKFQKYRYGRWGIAGVSECRRREFRGGGTGRLRDIRSRRCGLRGRRPTLRARRDSHSLATSPRAPGGCWLARVPRLQAEELNGHTRPARPTCPTRTPLSRVRGGQGLPADHETEIGVQHENLLIIRLSVERLAQSSNDQSMLQLGCGHNPNLAVYRSEEHT